MIVVVDTNVMVSAFLNPVGSSGRILNLLHEDRITIATTAHLWNEFLRVMEYGRIRKLLDSSHGKSAVDAILTALAALVVFHPDTKPRENWIPGDPDDDWVVQCALSAQAEYVISGDQHLQNLHEIEGIPIVSPAQFLRLLGPRESV
ncbi:MAG: putative toxin-antitoxin system toxin component, PIN family [Planctomycetes bacterium]|nr:putative toxin-antitoxin system toxin component, PIN family [Planctomycetota bacterium]